MADYTSKKQRGLVPAYYPVNSASYHEGAWRNRHGMTDSMLENDKRLLSQRPRAQRYHRFILPANPWWVQGTYPWLGRNSHD